MPLIGVLMSGTAKQVLQSVRLSGLTGSGDKYLGDRAGSCAKTQNSVAFPSCRLPEAAWGELAVLLVEWAEDS